MSSMSVNSLIDKNIEEDKEQPKSIPQKRVSSTNVEELQPPFQIHNRTSPSRMSTSAIPSLRRLSESLPHPPQQEELVRSPNKVLTDTGLLALLGSNVTSFPFSEDSFKDALKLRTEQERTKQEYYRVETANKNLVILQTALRAQIPTNLIPLMCIGNAPDLTEEQMKMMLQQPLPPIPPPPPSGPQFQAQPQSQQQQPQQPQQPLPQQQQPPPLPQQFVPIIQQQQQGPPIFMQPGLSQEQQIQIIQANQKRMQQELQQQGGLMPQTSPFQKAHRRSASSGGNGSGSIPQQDTVNVTGGPPLGFRFGAGSSGNRRPLSPAKIGAAAVANLATPTTPYRGFTSSSTRKIPTHHRHSSMPVETPNRHPIIDLNAADPNKGNSSLQSPLVGTTSTLQVKPIPAQPLHKQSKSHVQPSQESMTSFQHVIQFHHWKPTTTQPGTTSIGGSPIRTQSHKRRKSSVTNIPIQESSPIIPSKSRPDEPQIEQTSTERDKEEPMLESSTPKALTTSESVNKDDVDMDPDTSMDSLLSDTTASKVDAEANPPKAHHRNKSTFEKPNP